MSQTPLRNTPISLQWEAAYNSARELENYHANWDGADADPVPRELIQTTLQLFRKWEEGMTPAPDSVYALSDGTAMIEWHHQNGAIQTANVRHHGRVDMLGIDAQGKVTSHSETMTVPVETAGDS